MGSLSDEVVPLESVETILVLPKRILSVRMSSNKKFSFLHVLYHNIQIVRNSFSKARIYDEEAGTQFLVYIL